MFLSTHILASAALTHHIKNRLPHKSIIFVAAILASVLPDIDMLFTPFLKHHQTITHMPLFWVILSAAIITSSIWKRSTLTKSIGWGIAIGSLSHMVLDTIGLTLGIAWLAPFSWQEYSFFTLQPHLANNNYLKNYLTSGVFLVESIIFILSVARLAASVTRARKPIDATATSPGK